MLVISNDVSNLYRYINVVLLVFFNGCIRLPNEVNSLVFEIFLYKFMNGKICMDLQKGTPRIF